MAGSRAGLSSATANIGGTTRAAGSTAAPVQCSTGDLTLDGGGESDAVFVFRPAVRSQHLEVVLINGAQARNVYFQVGSSATLGVGPAIWQGNILAFTSITLNDNVTLNGRALARNAAVTLGNNNVITLP